MASMSAVLMKLEEEVVCPICLELLTEPLSLDCGHSFCQTCITVNSQVFGTNLGGENNCPICRVRYSPDNLRHNHHLSNIVQKLREVKVSLEKESKREICEHHGEKLQLFCQEDGKVICWLCERCQEHHGHHIFVLEEVAKNYKNQIATEKQNVCAKFNQLKSILDNEEQMELQKLQKEEEKVMSNLAEDENELVQQSQLAEELISDLEYRLQAPTVEMLQDVNSIMKRLNAIRVQTHYCAVLGSLSIKSGKHYWEVNVSEKTDWALGVCSGEIKVFYQQYGFCTEMNVSNRESDLSPENYERNYWAIGLENGSGYYASENSSASDGRRLHLYVSIRPCHIGIFLDYESRTISFFNVKNHGLLIYKFCNCQFPKTVYPFFNPMSCTGPMSLCSPPS
ncbi:E3 ubiquitin-protein ligase TRIM34-like [Rhynchocyon petersi]